MTSICNLTPQLKEIDSLSKSSSHSSLSHGSLACGAEESCYGPSSSPISQYDSHVDCESKLIRRASLGHKLMTAISNCKNNTIKRMSKKRKDLVENLPPLLPQPCLEGDKACLVLDLDETLIHSTFKPMASADFILGLEMGQCFYHVYMNIRPGAEEFIRKMSKIYEVVIFTASLGKYADPLIDVIDKDHLVKHRLFRESCLVHQGLYVKDLNRLGRDVRKTVIVDNSPAAYMFHPQNAIAISTWIGDKTDHELSDISELLESVSSEPDVVSALAKKNCEKSKIKK